MRSFQEISWLSSHLNYIDFRTPTRSIGDQEELIDSDDEDHFHDDVPSNNPFD